MLFFIILLVAIALGIIILLCFNRCEKYLYVKYSTPGREGIIYSDYVLLNSTDKGHKYEDGDYDRTKQRRAVGQIIDE